MAKLEEEHHIFLLGNINKHFRSNRFWDGERGDYKYWKGRRNLPNLKEVIDLVFGEEAEYIHKGYFKNNENEIVGGCVVIAVMKHPSFNGMHQSDFPPHDVYYSFILAENVFACTFAGENKILALSHVK